MPDNELFSILDNLSGEQATSHHRVPHVTGDHDGGEWQADTIDGKDLDPLFEVVAMGAEYEPLVGEEGDGDGDGKRGVVGVVVTKARGSLGMIGWRSVCQYRTIAY